MKIYLAGGMRSGWQDKIISQYPNINFIDPRNNGTSNPVLYALWDKQGIKECDILFAYLERDNPSGAGLAYEVGYANGLGKTVVMVSEKQDRYFDIVREAADICFDNIDEAIEYLGLIARIS